MAIRLHHLTPVLAVQLTLAAIPPSLAQAASGSDQYNALMQYIERRNELRPAYESDFLREETIRKQCEQRLSHLKGSQAAGSESRELKASIAAATKAERDHDAEMENLNGWIAYYASVVRSQQQVQQWNQDKDQEEQMRQQRQAAEQQQRLAWEQTLAAREATMAQQQQYYDYGYGGYYRNGRLIRGIPIRRTITATAAAPTYRTVGFTGRRF